jgi:hypothetical protein
MTGRIWQFFYPKQFFLKSRFQCLSALVITFEHLDRVEQNFLLFNEP